MWLRRCRLKPILNSRVGFFATLIGRRIFPPRLGTPIGFIVLKTAAKAQRLTASSVWPRGWWKNFGRPAPLRVGNKTFNAETFVNELEYHVEVDLKTRELKATVVILGELSWAYWLNWQNYHFSD